MSINNEYIPLIDNNMIRRVSLLYFCSISKGVLNKQIRASRSHKELSSLFNSYNSHFDSFHHLLFIEQSLKIKPLSLDALRPSLFSLEANLNSVNNRTLCYLLFISLTYNLDISFQAIKKEILKRAPKLDIENVNLVLVTLNRYKKEEANEVTKALVS